MARGALLRLVPVLGAADRRIDDPAAPHVDASARLVRAVRDGRASGDRTMDAPRVALERGAHTPGGGALEPPPDAR